ncbi:hypothetical protein JD844_004275 [Phrynosoma platyrhinos]|uniref:Shisa N-terminal domain-containing protein n=1 Tax=Phrynosoma platyrhinos TaxID=52577 RepID=A0ABQ7TN73_PHRPL|nr:hypothetical protein JD844_004275 [Phrynosoma platyrhinos]
MDRTCLCILFLILAPKEPIVKGEMCRSWMLGIWPKFGFGPFRCPLEGDDPEAQFCCGTCRRPYCCASQADRLDGLKCLAEILVELQGTPDGRGRSATTLNMTLPQSVPSGGDLRGIDSGEIGNYTSLNITSFDPENERVPWNYYWLLPISLGLLIICISLFVIVPYLRKHGRNLNYCSREEQSSPPTVRLPLAPTPLLRSAVARVPRSNDAHVGADPPSQEAEVHQGTLEMPPGSNNPSKVPPSAPGSGNHEMTIFTSASPPPDSLEPSLEEILTVGVSF